MSLYIHKKHSYTKASTKKTGKWIQNGTSDFAEMSIKFQVKSEPEKECFKFTVKTVETVFANYNA